MSNTPLKVLIVDNHPLFLESISRILSSTEYEVKTAIGGLEAIDLIEEFHPQIFIIDLIMPYISGEKLCKYIRSLDTFKDSFIAILSGIAKETEKISIPPGADAFIAKGPMKHMAGNIFDVIDLYRNKKRDVPFENLLGLNEIAPRHITKELLFSLRHLEVLLDNMREGVIELSLDNRIVYINPSAVKILDSSEMDLISKNLLSIFHDEDRQKFKTMLSDFDSGLKVKDVILSVNKHFVQIDILKVVEGTVEAKIILLNDVTRFKEKEARLQKALAEKEMLIREVHHRVKNNLNVISGLISIQSSMIDDVEVQGMLLEIQPRLQSISLVHDKLYNTEDLSNIYLNSYMEELAMLLIGMMTNSEFAVNLDIDIREITLDTDTIVSLGLISTELITNALKYGFYSDNPEENTLRISFDEGERNRLRISNNGRPFPVDLDINSSRKLGFQVINLLVGQINGELELKRDPVTEFSIIF